MNKLVKASRRVATLMFQVWAVFLALALLLPSIPVSASTATTTTLASSNNASVYGESITFTATISPNTAIGAVAFKEGTNSLGTGTVSAGTATFSTASLSVGNHTIKAYFVSGDSTYNDSTSGSITQAVSKAETEISLVSSEPDSDYRSEVTLTATVTATGESTATPAGNVTFKDGTTTLGTDSLSSGEATYVTSNLSAGTHTLTAVYAGNESFKTSTSSSITQTVTKRLMVSTLMMRPAFTALDYSQTLAAEGGSQPYTWTKSGTLPTGMAFSTAGVFSGKPATAGEYSFTVTVTDSTAATALQTLTIVVGEPGYLYNWGDNTYGQLGNDSTNSSSGLIQTNTLNSDNIIAAATGGSHNLAANKKGVTYAWGNNDNGQIGNSSTTTPYKEPDIVDDLDDAIALAAGFKHSLALDVNGAVWSWGDNAYGQLGVGSTTDKKKATQISGLTDVVAISAGYYHSLALKADGTVWAWGYNNKGQLGINSNTNKDAPVQVLGGDQDGTYLTDIVAIAAGNYFGLAVDKDGYVWAWGDNSAGQLGNGSTTTTKTPVKVDDISGVIAVSAGSLNSLALDVNGDVFAWGDNAYGQIGVGTTVDKTAPVQVDDINDIVSIAAGAAHSLAIDQSGDLYVWGYNNKGQLGLGSTTNYKTPEKVDDVDGSSLFIAAGGSNSLFISSEEISSTTVTLTTASLDDGVKGQAYSETLTASGGSGTYKWSKSAGTLPTGLSLNASTGKISGTPSAAGDFTFTIKVADSDDSSSYDTVQFSVSIEGNSSYDDVVIDASELEDGKVDSAYSQTLSAEGGSGGYKWYKNSGSMPPGLNLGVSSGKIAGTPTTAGDYTFVIKVVDSADDSLSDTASFTITIKANDVTTTIAISGLTSATALVVNSKGVTSARNTLTSSDKKLTLDIASGTSLLDSNGVPVTNLKASAVNSVLATPTGSILIEAYELGPEGLKFNPSIKSTFKYDKSALPEGVDENSLYIALYNGSQWNTLANTRDINNSTVSANIEHFSTYAMFGKLPTTTPTTSTTTTKPTTSTTPSGTQTTTTTTSQTTPTNQGNNLGGSINWWLIIGIAGGVLVILIVILIVIQKNKGTH
jgi:alpha-tubulin suppressor-like RCC1 family protein